MYTVLSVFITSEPIQHILLKKGAKTRFGKNNKLVFYCLIFYTKSETVSQLFGEFFLVVGSFPLITGLFYGS